MPSYPFAELPRQAAGEGDKNPAEKSAGEAADDATDRHCDPGWAKRHQRRGRAEISIVADKPKRGEAGGDDRSEDEAAGARLEGPAQLLDAEDDAGERRVEGSGDPGRGAREQQAALIFERAPP